MFNKSLFAAFAATAVMGFAGIAKADSLSSVSATGTFTSDNAQYIAISMRGSAYQFSDPSQAAQFSGNVYIVGYSGNLALNMGAPIASLSFDTTLIDGVSYPRAHLATKRFFFVNLATQTKTLATAEVDIVKKGGHGMICFTVTSVADGSTLAQTCDNAGNLIDLPLTSGSVVVQSR